jgi:hypothetical protein
MVAADYRMTEFFTFTWIITSGEVARKRRAALRTAKAECASDSELKENSCDLQGLRDGAGGLGEPCYHNEQLLRSDLSIPARVLL